MAALLVIASGNAGKAREFGHLLADLHLQIQPQPEGLEVEETGDSFAANARLKAETVARATGCWALADDSGLSVSALGGAPGVHSARYADSDEARIARLLRELEGASDRTAQFTAALAVADPSGTIRLEVEGICPGLILEEQRGDGGFGPRAARAPPRPHDAPTLRGFALPDDLLRTFYRDAAESILPRR